MEKVLGLHWAIAKVVKEARESRRYTQGQLAGFAGLSEVYLSKLERGIRGDSVNALMLIAIALQIPFSELMRRIEVEMVLGPGKPVSLLGRPPREAQPSRACKTIQPMM